MFLYKKDFTMLSANSRHDILFLNSAQLIIGDSAPISTLRQQITLYAQSIFPVLIEGESGTGKELVATALHQQSPRNDKPFLVINCASISGELLESQLFGHIKGAFTGADKSHCGFFEAAEDGTLFLDEIGEMAYDLQAKLLRVLESGEFHRIGDTKIVKSRARIIAATNKSLQEQVTQGLFRTDLFHRLCILKLHSPALRNRQNDSFLLLQYFLDFYAESIQPITLDHGAKEKWKAYPFPGNVRELRNIVIRLCTKYPLQSINSFQLLQEFDQSSSIYRKLKHEHCIFNQQLIHHKIINGDFNLDLYLKHLEDLVIEQALLFSNGNLSRVAKILRINRSTLYSRIHKYDS
jgi:DNA-binding NtrC family response regulator